MTSEEIIALIEIASKLAVVINAEVTATTDSAVKAAWKEAQQMYDTGYDDAYEKPVVG